MSDEEGGDEILTPLPSGTSASNPQRPVGGSNLSRTILLEQGPRRVASRPVARPEDVNFGDMDRLIGSSFLFFSLSPFPLSLLCQYGSTVDVPQISV